MDRASQALAQSIPHGVRATYRALAEHHDVARSTLHARAHGRRSNEEKAQILQRVEARRVVYSTKDVIQTLTDAPVLDIDLAVIRGAANSGNAQAGGVNEADMDRVYLRLAESYYSDSEAEGVGSSYLGIGDMTRRESDGLSRATLDKIVDLARQIETHGRIIRPIYVPADDDS